LLNDRSMKKTMCVLLFAGMVGASAPAHAISFQGVKTSVGKLLRRLTGRSTTQVATPPAKPVSAETADKAVPAPSRPIVVNPAESIMKQESVKKQESVRPAPDKVVVRPAVRPASFDRPVERPSLPKTTLKLAKIRGSGELLTELKLEDYGEMSAYAGSRANITFEAPKTGAKVQKLVWLHGAGQIPNNLIIRRLSRAFAAEGVALEIHSMEYEGGGLAEIKAFIDAQTEPVFIGGHSAGGAEADDLLKTPNAKIKGGILLNDVGSSGSSSQVPVLVLRGNVRDGGVRHVFNPKVTAIEIDGADHSLRYNPRDEGGPAKEMHNRTVDTWELNLAVARHVKDFIAKD
jgi:hypothetical protein